MGDRRGAYGVLVGRSEGKRPLVRPKLGGDDDIKMDLREVGWGAWTGLIWLRIGTGGGHLTSWGSVSFSGRTLLLVIS
jgi:hypothetical protein